MEKVSAVISAFNRYIGQSMAWLAAAMTILTVGIILLRIFWQQGSIAAQESVIYMHSALILLTMAYTVSCDGHVRVDVCYRLFSPAQQAWVNMIGSLVLLLPFAAFICGISWDFALRSWGIQESSANPGGLPFVYVLKTLIPLSGSLLVLQACAQVLGNLCLLKTLPCSHFLRRNNVNIPS